MITIKNYHNKISDLKKICQDMLESIIEIQNKHLSQDKSILLVDDDQKACSQLAALLEEAGYKVTTVNDGKSALESARLTKPSLVLLDMIMDGMDGWDFLQERKNDLILQTIPVLIITCIALTDEWATSLGATACLSKPIDISHLLEELPKYYNFDKKYEN